MSSKYARGKIALAQCDRCGMEYLLKTLRPLTIKTRITNILVCPTCWEPDQPQLQIGMYPISDPQALRNPRPDTGLIASRGLFAWNPVATQTITTILNGVVITIN